MQVKKILNDRRQVVPELLEGIIAAYGGSVRQLESAPGALVKTELAKGKVGLLVGGGSGHEPLFPAFLGKNMADGAACGAVFAAPPPSTVLEATRALDQGAGVLYLYGNYAGDNMNFDIAAEMAAEEGIRTATVRVWDDVASAPLSKIEERRGIAGDVFIIKVAGAATAAGLDLAAAAALTARARDNTRSIGVAVSAGSIPETGAPTFELPADEIEIGMGLHGEPGVSREKMLPADALVDRMLAQLLPDLPFTRGDEVVALVNDLGSTTQMELWIANRRLHQVLRGEGLKVRETILGSYCTCQEMAGYSISLMKLDAELARCWDVPADSVAFKKV